MTDYVLVHGGNVSSDTWNELVQREAYPPGERLGGKMWDKVSSYLAAHNHRVFAPTLLDEHKCSLSDHIEQIVALITEQNLNEVILVGSSYGGMVITGVADKVPDKIGVLVYLDAAFPSPGQSLYDILLAAEYNPKEVLGGLPKAYIEKIKYDERRLERLFKVYVQCTESTFLSVSEMARQKIASLKGWKLVKLATSHLPQATMPNKLVELLLGFAR